MSKLNNLHPYFVTGFVDAESSFILLMRRDSRLKSGWHVKLIFSIGLHKKDSALLVKIKKHFGGIGSITKQGVNSVSYRVFSIKDLEVVINHFDKYPLITQKWSNYQLFKQAFKLVKAKEHLTVKGINKLLATKATINNDFFNTIKADFPNIKLLSKPTIKDQSIKNPNWLSGFISGEGCFFVNIFKATTKIKFSVSLRFYITQHSKDEPLLRSFISMLGCGKYFKQSTKSGIYTIYTLSDINGKLIPFLNKYPIYGVKALDFLDFCKLAELILNKTHLTLKGLENIKEIKNGMNKNRVLPLNTGINNIQVINSSTNFIIPLLLTNIENWLRIAIILSNP